MASNGDRYAVGAGHAVGQDDDVIAAGDGLLRAVAETVEHGFHAFGAECGVIGEVERLGVEAVLEMADVADLFEIRVGQDRLAHLQPLLLRCALVVEDVRTRADEGDEAHHQFFADRIDRRIGDLGEVLLEIAEQQLGARRHRRNRRVRAHRADRLLAGDGHRRHQEGRIFLAVAKGLLAVEQRHIHARTAGFDGLEISSTIWVRFSHSS